MLLLNSIIKFTLIISLALRCKLPCVYCTWSMS